MQTRFLNMCVYIVAYMSLLSSFDLFKHINNLDSKLICLAVHLLNERCATSELTA